MLFCKLQLFYIKVSRKFDQLLDIIGCYWKLFENCFKKYFDFEENFVELFRQNLFFF